MEQQYNRAKWWQLLLFVFNNTASNIYLMTLMYVSYYANGVAGLGVAFVSNVIMLARFWDGLTDPVIGFVVDKTNGRFGKFRPFMLLGNLIMLGTIMLMFTTTHLVSGGLRAVYWVVLYMVYIIGYTFQNSATRGGQTVLTNDPKQRPMFARIDSIINALLMTGLTVYITSYLATKHGGFTASLFIELISVLGPASLTLTILAVIGLWQKDQPERYNALGKQASYGFKDIFHIIKNNRAIQMLVVAASTDKLATQIRGNATVGIMLYGIVIGNYALLGKMSMITLVPNMIIIIVGTSIASKLSSKKATIIFTWVSIIFTVLLAALLIFGDPAEISLENIGFMTVAFLLLYIFANGAVGVTTGLATPMIADCADYELYKSGNYAPALMGTVFGFFDKVVSSFASTIVGYCVIAIGFTEKLPTADDPYSTPLFWMTMFLFIGTPLIGWVCSLLAMKFYPLDKEKMIEVQEKIAGMKKSA
ncbi:MAG: glucuronide permease [Eubacterium sp.]|nr:glucuronide permease [Eubacterium sp.]MCI8918385.1 glucuronide permease [Eubacterium sp.]